MMVRGEEEEEDEEEEMGRYKLRQVEDDHENVWRKQSLYFDLRLSRT